VPNFLEHLQSFETFLLQYTQTHFTKQPKNLYEPCEHILKIGGKRVRPIALLLTHELFEPITEEAQYAALGIELFHNFTLIHDDIMDNAPLRRGAPTVHEKWNLPIAILSGDVMNVHAYECMNRVPQKHLTEVLKVFNKTAIEVCEGQQLDMDFECREDVSIAEYIHMITLKTSVLLAASMEIGALLSGSSVATAEMLYEFGKNLGISFQLKDDYLDAFGTSAKIGKQIGGDILANKKTFLLLTAFEKANESQKQELNNLIADTSANKVANTLALFEQLGVPDATTIAKTHYSNIAFEILEKLPVQDAKKGALRELAQMLLEREG
jgi:geranylgeranyl diphosphate synthase, type II